MSDFEILNETIDKEKAVINAAHERIRELERKRDERVRTLYDAVNERAQYAKAWPDVESARKDDWRAGLAVLDAYDAQKSDGVDQRPSQSLNYDLSCVFNAHGVDAEMQTHDFVLAEMVELFLNTIKHRNRRERVLNGVPTVKPKEPFDEGPDLPDEVGTGKPNGEGGYYPTEDPFAEPVTDATDQSGAWKS